MTTRHAGAPSPSSPSPSLFSSPLLEKTGGIDAFSFLFLFCRWWRKTGIDAFPLGELFPLRLGYGWWPRHRCCGGYPRSFSPMKGGHCSESSFSFCSCTLLYASIMVYQKKMYDDGSGETTLTRYCPRVFLFAPCTLGLP